MGTAANGGSGVVVIRIPCAPASAAVTGTGNTLTPGPSDSSIARFIVSGTLTI
jgi:hypothetical protein